MPVYGDLVPAVDDRARERRTAGDLLSDEEERGRCAVTGELLEHGGRALRMRAVIEGEGHAIAGDAAVDAVRGSEPRHVRGERGGGPVEPHTTSESTSDAAEGSDPSARPGAGREASAVRSARSSSRGPATTAAMP